jgi:hypothetical protein
VKGFGGKKKEILAVEITVVIWTIWKTRNLACFEKKWHAKHYVVLLKICYYINCWSFLVKEDVKDQLELCAKVLEKVAIEVFGARRSWVSWTPRLAM